MAAFVLVPVAAEAKTFKNTLTKAQWTAYGVNPWRLDTDNDGYSDSWEVKNKYCPTSADSISLDSAACEKGTIDFKKQIYTPPAALADSAAREVHTFASCTELKKTFTDVYNTNYNYNLKEVMPLESAQTPLSTTDLGLESGLATGFVSTVSDYSSTNVQVEGVDEGDSIETDGKYVYALAGGIVYVTQATPAKDAKVVAEIDVRDANAQSLYLNNKFLTVVGTRYGLPDNDQNNTFGSSYSYYRPFTVVQLWSIADPEHPTKVRSMEFQGNIISSRVTNGFWYAAMYDQPLSYATDIKTTPIQSLLPQYRDQVGKNIDSAGGFKQLAPCNAISYVAPYHDSSYTEIVAVPVNSASGKITSKVVFGAGSTVYMSSNNLYVFSSRSNWNWMTTAVNTRSWTDQTEIYKFSLNKNAITLAASQTVPGTVLNQFSADENTYNGQHVLRLATTVRDYTATPYVKNNLYTFDADLNRIGWSEGFGGDEQIYAVRFVGNRAYVITYKNTDPLFVFDLANPRAPHKLGELHMTGYSTYLQPYDETHLIGIGKDAVIDTEMGSNFAWYQGMKMALFDVTDPHNPIQQFSTSIGDRGTDSLALYDHHALLFSKKKNLLALPVSVVQLTDEQKNATDTPYWSYGSPTYNGLYVYHIDLTHGFQFLGGVSHANMTGQPVYMYSDNSITRSLYIGNMLYAFSPQELSIHNLNDLTTVKEVTLQGDRTSGNGIVRGLLGL